jgi:glycosyltransferase involved in cell wall biosynthesis
MNDIIEILWVGRLIKWKRPFDALYTVEYLLRRGLNVHLTMIGTGMLESDLKAYVINNDLKRHVDIMGAVDAKDVRRYMEKAAIYLMTSNKEEGWGAVVNEAMNSGCVVYAYYRVGSAPYLIKHGINGKLYTQRTQLMRQLESDLNHKNILHSMGKQAYQTIFSTWNADVAAQKFVEISSKLINYEIPVLPFDGPMSNAPVLTGYHIKRRFIRNR